MRMRESVRSLQAYFIVAGLLFGVPAALSLVSQPIVLMSVPSVVAVALAAAYLFLGIRLRTLLPTSPRQILFVVLVNAAGGGIQLIANIIVGSASGILGSAFGLLIAWYLYINVRRLSSELVAAASPSSPSGA